jgi:anti-sigma-K factor RskA
VSQRNRTRAGGGDPHTLAAAYAMDAVPEPDRARFERHLAGCDSCRQEVRGMREATAALAAASAVQPPAALRETVLRASEQTRQFPPPVVQARAARNRRGWPGWPGRWPRLAVATVGALACVLAVVAVVSGVLAYRMQNRLDQAQVRDHTVAMVLGAPDATMLSAHVSTGGTATVVMSHRERALVFTAADLRVLPSAESYELWLTGPAGSKPAGMVNVPGRGKMVGPMVVSGLSAGESVRLTVEPSSGSPRPTSPPIMVIILTASQ